MLAASRRNRHQPVYSADFIINAATRDLRTGERLLDFNEAFPTWRHWHHEVHSAFGLPCDDLCKPAYHVNHNSGESLISRIKAAYRIEEIAEMHTRLRGQRVLKGKCFLHGEVHGEAFTVWPDEQRWRCFGACNIGGDVIDLVSAMRERGLDWQAKS